MAIDNSISFSNDLNPHDPNNSKINQIYEYKEEAQEFKISENNVEPSVLDNNEAFIMNNKFSLGGRDSDFVNFTKKEIIMEAKLNKIYEETTSAKEEGGREITITTDLGGKEGVPFKGNKNTSIFLTKNGKSAVSFRGDIDKGENNNGAILGVGGRSQTSIGSATESKNFYYNAGAEENVPLYGNYQKGDADRISSIAKISMADGMKLNSIRNEVDE